MSEKDPPLPVESHLKELRRRLLTASISVLICSIIAAPLSPSVFSMLARPLLEVMPTGSAFVALTPFEAWLSYFKIALTMGIIASTPVWLGQVFAFFSPAIRGVLKRRVLFAACLGGVFFIAGAAFCYFFILPSAMSWGLEIISDSDIKLMPQMAPYISLVTNLLISFGTAFELPIVVSLIIYLGILDVTTVSRARRYVVVGAFIFGAVMTPTQDVVTQLALAIPLIILFELGLFFGRILSAVRHRACPSPGHLI